MWRALLTRPGAPPPKNNNLSGRNPPDRNTSAEWQRCNGENLLPRSGMMFSGKWLCICVHLRFCVRRSKHHTSSNEPSFTLSIMRGFAVRPTKPLRMSIFSIKPRVNFAAIFAIGVNSFPLRPAFCSLSVSLVPKPSLFRLVPLFCSLFN